MLNNNSLDGILSGFTKTVTRLEAFVSRRERDAALADEEIAVANGKKLSAESDAARAATIRGKIQDLLAA